MSYQVISNLLQEFQNPKRAKFSQTYFPRGGELGDRKDLFYGGSVPQTRQVAKKFTDLEFAEIAKLLGSNYHEERLCGLMILRLKLDKALKNSDEEAVQEIKSFYLENLPAVDHWDLVDESAGSILGRILVHSALQQMDLQEFERLTDFQDPESGFPTLSHLASSSNIWHKRISIITSFAFIKAGNLDIPLSICQYHIECKQHYIQKANGWVLREVGKKDRPKLDQFLTKNIQKIPSICLSYALEKHTKEEKQKFRQARGGV